MVIINPHFKVDEDNNIFTIRKKEYDYLEEKVRQILVPAEELGFAISEFELRDSKFSSGELYKTVKKNLVIRLKKGNSEIDLSMAVPKLMDNNYIIINGRKKIPQFQLFDIPIVTRGKTIKLRLNVATLMLVEGKTSPYIDLSIIGRKVPLALIMNGYYGPEALVERFDFDNLEVTGTDMYDKLLMDLKMYHEESKDVTQDDFIKEIGEYYSKYNSRVKGEDLIYALDLMLRTDLESAHFFKTDSILEELMEALQNHDMYDDTDFRNKRVRCVEYMVIAKVAKAVFDLCMSNRTARQPKFNVNTTQILSECNVSDIVQFDFAINPIDEMTKLSRITLVGPGGFKRESIPEHLRDICPTMFGRLCPVDTPDRDNCGVLQNILPNVKLDEHKRFTEECLSKQPVSAPVSMTPFLEHDDQTRLQMAASQMRQAIMLKNFDKPLIQSGCEGLYTDFTQFLKRAKKDGKVLHVGNKYIIVSYDDGEIDLFDISYRKIYVENMDFMNIYVQPDDKFKAGDILAESNFSKNGEIVFGKNLLTAVMVYYGYNYEDGIVISDRVVEKDLFTSAHYKDLSFTLPPNKILVSLDEENYKPLPEPFEWVESGVPYAIMKETPGGAIDYCSIFEEDIPLSSKKRTLITEVNIYPNVWNTDIPEFKSWIQNKIDKQKKDEDALKRTLLDHLSKVEATQLIKDRGLDRHSHVGKYKVKGEKINGIQFEIFGIYFRKIEAGDKIANRHGNKGVIAKIIPHEKMPRLDDGRRVDVCINPLGIISRMNVGQLFELHLSMALDDLKIKLNKMLKEGEDPKKIKKKLVKFIFECDNTEGHWYTKQFYKQIPKEVDEAFINDLSVIQPPFESITMQQLKKTMKVTDSPFTYRLFDPIAKEYLQNPIAVGYIYFFRMVHIAETRLAARGIGSYTRRTLQPLAGRKNRGGQRCGEMETACLIAHDSPHNLFEFLTTKSDCIDLKNRYIRRMIESDLVREDKEDSIVAESVKLLDSYLTVIGISKD